MCTIFEKGKTLYEKQATLLCLTFSAPMQINLEVTLLEPSACPTSEWHGRHRQPQQPCDAEPASAGGGHGEKSLSAGGVLGL